MIDSKDISVIVQGSIDKKNTPLCLKSIRKYLPDAEIILSIWKNSNVEGLDYDVLLYNVDPGGFKHDFAIQNQRYSMNNFNRQLVSTKGGLLRVNRKYCLKLRSDLILKNKKFLEYFNKFNIQNEKYKFFNHRVLCCTLYSREYSCKAGTGFPTPFHTSDFWFFGLTDDLKDYFLSCPMQTEEEASNWGFKYPNRLPYKTMLWRYAPEQHFCINWVKKHFPNVQFDDWSDWNKENIELSNNILYNNFIFLGYKESGFFCPKHRRVFKTENEISGLITYKRFQEQYKKYCDGNYIVVVSEKNYKQHLQIHFEKFIKPFKMFNSWVSELFSVIFYAISFILITFKKGKKDD